MRSLKMLMGALLFVCLAGVSSAQTFPGKSKPPPAAPVKSALELALETAFRANPDLRVALARLNEAEAELARVRLQVAQKVVTAFRAVEAAQATVQNAAQRLESTRLGFDSGREKATAVQQAEQTLADARAKLAAAETELNYLLGKSAAKETAASGAERALYAMGVAQAHLAFAEAVRYTPAVERGPAADRIRKALEQRTTVKFNGMTARQALEEIQKKAPGLHIQAAVKLATWDEKVTAALTDVPLSAALQLIEDVVGQRIVVRGYGLLIVPQDRVPPGAMLLADFLKAAAPAEKKR